MGQIRKVQIIEKCYSTEQGCTEPIKVELDDGTKAILKYPKNPQGLIVLVNEYVAYHLAKRIGVTCPAFGVAVIGDDTKSDIANGIPADISIFRGTGFFCEYVSGWVKVSPKVLQIVSNIDETSRIILLDEIVKNSDRHVANAIVSIREHPAKLYAIDHSHAFGDPDWNQATLALSDAASPYVWKENRDFYTMLINAGASVDDKALNAASKVISERVTSDFLDSVMESLPVDWVAEVGVSNIGHMKEYVLYRVQNIGEICEMIKRERGV